MKKQSSWSRSCGVWSSSSLRVRREVCLPNRYARLSQCRATLKHEPCDLITVKSKVSGIPPSINDLQGRAEPFHELAIFSSSPVHVLNHVLVPSCSLPPAPSESLIHESVSCAISLLYPFPVSPRMCRKGPKSRGLKGRSLPPRIWKAWNDLDP